MILPNQAVSRPSFAIGLSVSLWSLVSGLSLSLLLLFPVSNLIKCRLKTLYFVQSLFVNQNLMQNAHNHKEMGSLSQIEPRRKLIM